jgi:FAD/FMN-containing dehydrogenase
MTPTEIALGDYGELWGEFRKRKQRYDPDNILSPGSGMFS